MTRVRSPVRSVRPHPECRVGDLRRVGENAMEGGRSMNDRPGHPGNGAASPAIADQDPGLIRTPLHYPTLRVGRT